MAKKSIRTFTSKVGEQEVNAMIASAKNDILKVVYGSDKVKGDGFNQNTGLACPHIKMQKSSIGGGTQVLSALSDQPVEVKEETFNIYGTDVKIKVPYHKCSVCGGKIPMFTGVNTLKDSMQSASDIYKLAGMTLQSDLFLKAAYQGEITIPGFTPEGKRIAVLTGGKLLKQLTRNAQHRIGRFELVRNLRNLSEVCKVMSTGSLKKAKKVNIFEGKALTKRAGSVFDETTGSNRKMKFISDNTGLLSSSEGKVINKRNDGATGNDGVSVE